ncbi:MAG: ArsR family transcriptional regulator [Candidatus Methanofastidiosa archaeon]|nr:ArsR family transcriptional regulator [Candidatus Methanofastidiosa archaeon]
MADKEEDIFHILSIDDEKAKILAMEIANDKGRMVLEAIFEGKKSSTEIAKELKMNLPTVLFHIERLREAGLVKIIDTNLSKKFREIKYYGSSKKAILIVPAKDKDSMEDAASSLVSGISMKLVGITGLIGAALTGGLLKIFSNDAMPLYDDQYEVLTVPPTEVADAGRNVLETVQTLPSTAAIIGIVLVSALVAISVMMLYQRSRRKISIS